MARRLLRKQYTDGDIDEMLRPDSLSYNDVVRFLGQGGSGSGSLIKLVLIQALSVDESVWLDRFFTGVLSPLFFVETLADLGKEMGRRSPENEVRIIADNPKAPKHETH